MFWDNVSVFYDIFEKWYNGDVNQRLVKEVSNLIEHDDIVLECACGTGMISRGIVSKCKELTATDFSEGMLKQVVKKLANSKNVIIKRANIMNLEYDDESFNKVIAGNVIHLLDEPYKALDELMRVCKKGGQVIIPTYVNKENAGRTSLFIRCLEKLGADFKKQFDFESYRQFFEKLGMKKIEYKLVTGKMPCAIAVISKI